MEDQAIAVRITENGEIPLPEQMRKELGLVPEQEVRLLRRGKELVIQPITDESSRQEQIEAILRRAKLRAAFLSPGLTEQEAWAIYDQAADRLGQAIRQTEPEP